MPKSVSNLRNPLYKNSDSWIVRFAIFQYEVRAVICDRGALTNKIGR